MNALFEKFVEELVAEEARRAGLELRPQGPVKLADHVRMSPDLLLLGDGMPVAVGDVKYVEVHQGLPNANLYQLLAYCVALGLPRGLLIYASNKAPEVHRVRHAGIELEVVGIDMSLPREGLVNQARDVAARLVAHAEAIRPPSKHRLPSQLASQQTGPTAPRRVAPLPGHRARHTA